MPILSMVLIPRALSVSRTERPSVGTQYRRDWMLGSNRRRVRRWECEMRLPKTGATPVS